jgi:hypothetical protein
MNSSLKGSDDGALQSGLTPGGLRLAQPGGPTARDSVLPFYLKTEEDPTSETM